MGRSFRGGRPELTMAVTLSEQGRGRSPLLPRLGKARLRCRAYARRRRADEAAGHLRLLIGFGYIIASLVFGRSEPLHIFG